MWPHGEEGLARIFTRNLTAYSELQFSKTTISYRFLAKLTMNSLPSIFRRTLWNLARYISLRPSGSLSSDPMNEFRSWYASASKSPFIAFPEAFCLATFNGEESESRFMMMEAFCEDGFVFCTDARSTKAKTLSRHPKASMTFYWGGLAKQVRISGAVELLAEDEMSSIFARQSRTAQLVSSFSSPTTRMSSEEFQGEMKAAKTRYKGLNVPRPTTWVAYILKPQLVIFSTFSPDLYHEERRYIKDDSGSWRIA